MSWTPYRNLFFYSLSRAEKEVRRVPSYAEARSRATAIGAALLGYPEHMVDKREAAWPKASDGDVGRMRKYRIKDDLHTFITRGRRVARVSLDRLILAYAAIGHLPAHGVKQAWLDYMSIPDMLPISEEDAFIYASLYWDFCSLWDIEPGIQWLESNLPASPEIEILKGTVDLDTVRAMHGVTRAINVEQRQGRLAMKVMRILESMFDDLLARQRAELVSGIERQGRNGPYYTTEHMKSVASFMASSAPIVKTYLEIKNDTGENQSLSDFIRFTVDQISAEEAELSEFLQPYDELQPEGLTLEEMRAQNEAMGELNTDDNV